MKTSRLWKIGLIGFIAIVCGFFLDDLMTGFLISVRFDILTAFMHFVTDFGLVLLVILIGIKAVIQKKYKLNVFMIICALFAVEAGFLLKLFFQVPRPYLLSYELPLMLASGYAFPSMHAAFVGALLPFQKYFFSKRSRPWIYILMLLIVISRMYLGVHLLSDIAAGFTLGLLVSYSILLIEDRFHTIEWIQDRVKDKFELRRQIAHLFIGMSIVVLLKLHLLNGYLLAFVTIAGGMMVIIARKVRVPVIHKILEYFERPHHMARFPGRGSFFMVLGATLCVFLFEKNIAMAAIMIMAIGDSVTNVVGRYFGRLQNPFNSKKNLEGTGIAIVASTLGALYFVSFWPALIASTIAMIVESLDLGLPKFKIELDDNVVIPLIAGAIMTVMM